MPAASEPTAPSRDRATTTPANPTRQALNGDRFHLSFNPVASLRADSAD